MSGRSAEAPPPSAPPADARAVDVPPADALETAPDAPATGGLGTTDLRRFWPQILENVKNRRRFTWILLSQNAQVVEVREGVLTLGLSNVGARESFGRGGSPDVLREAILEVLGVALHIEPIVDASAAPAAATPVPSPAAQPAPAVPARSAAAQEARANLRATRSQATPPDPEPEEEPSREDDVVEDSASTDELMIRHLGAELIAEDDN